MEQHAGNQRRSHKVPVLELAGSTTSTVLCSSPASIRYACATSRQKPDESSRPHRQHNPRHDYMAWRNIQKIIRQGMWGTAVSTWTCISATVRAGRRHALPDRTYSVISDMMPPDWSS